MSFRSPFHGSRELQKNRRTNHRRAGCQLRSALTAALLAFSATLQAQSTVGDWNLSPWVYGGRSFSTTTVNSDGSTPVGLFATANSTATSFLNGESDGMASFAMPYLVAPGATSTYLWNQSYYFLNAAVNFGIPSSQSQFANPITDNGVGIRIKSESAIDIIGYNLKISLTGSGVFSSVVGEYEGFRNLTGLGTNTITLEWNPLATIDGMASFDGIQISGGITGFSVMHEVTYFNNLPSVLDVLNFVELKVNTTESKIGVPGDYNQNGTVDAADYVLWRNSPSSFGGDPGGYNTWRTHFGQPTSGNAAIRGASNTKVPEPGSTALLALAVLAILRCPGFPRI